MHEFEYEWVSRSGTHISGIKKGATWKCTSLFSAYQQYIWPSSIKNLNWNGRFFDETEVCLKELKDNLEKSININDGNNTRKICRQIFEWGGVDVEIRKNVSPNIKIDIPVYDLPQHLIDTKKYLNNLIVNGCSGSFNSTYEDSKGHQILLDSGTTKIYSLICEKFIIYDGRVASALGYLVKRWWEEDKMQGKNLQASYKEIPQCLKFSHDKYNKIVTQTPKTAKSFDLYRIKALEELEKTSRLHGCFSRY